MVNSEILVSVTLDVPVTNLDNLYLKFSGKEPTIKTVATASEFLY